MVLFHRSFVFYKKSIDDTQFQEFDRSLQLKLRFQNRTTSLTATHQYQDAHCLACTVHAVLNIRTYMLTIKISLQKPRVS
jgi:ABC-type nitrate/sulfonate/bicarbonate transport system ATPase subunit